MQRLDHLKTLSWEHHDALKYAHRLRKGIARGTDVDTLRRYLHLVVEHHLRPHFGQEESILVDRLSDEQRKAAVVQKVLEEHQQMLALAEEIAHTTGDVASLMTRFADMLKQHVRLEQAQFFPYIENTLSTQQLESAQHELEERHVPGHLPWDLPFWKS